MGKRILIISRHSPYGSHMAREAVEAALAAGVFELEVSLLFMDEGVWQLLPGQQPQDLPAKSLAGMLDALPLYGVERLHVDGQSLLRRGLSVDTLPASVEVLEGEALALFIASHDSVLTL